MTAAALRVEPEVDTLPRRLWLIVTPDGQRYSSSFTPAATRAEVLALYPSATVEPEADSSPVDAPAEQDLPETPTAPTRRPGEPEEAHP